MDSPTRPANVDVMPLLTVQATGGITLKASLSVNCRRKVYLMLILATFGRVYSCNKLWSWASAQELVTY